MINEEKEIICLIKEDRWMMQLLKDAKSLNLPDWWICAGFVRSKIWDTVHNKCVRTSLPDIDVIYYNPDNTKELEEKKYENQLKSLRPNTPWSVKNQARMHLVNKMNPYTSSTDAISKFPETATALGVKLDEFDNVLLTAPWGTHDVLHLIVKPTPYFVETEERFQIFQDRVCKKNWISIWSRILLHPYGEPIND